MPETGQTVSPLPTPVSPLPTPGVQITGVQVTPGAQIAGVQITPSAQIAGAQIAPTQEARQSETGNVMMTALQDTALLPETGGMMVEVWVVLLATMVATVLGRKLWKGSR